jgi:hypothetical protein
VQAKQERSSIFFCLLISVSPLSVTKTSTRYLHLVRGRRNRLVAMQPLIKKIPSTKKPSLLSATLVPGVTSPNAQTENHVANTIKFEEQDDQPLICDPLGDWFCPTVYVGRWLLLLQLTAGTCTMLLQFPQLGICSSKLLPRLA